MQQLSLTALVLAVLAALGCICSGDAGAELQVLNFATTKHAIAQRRLLAEEGFQVYGSGSSVWDSYTSSANRFYLGSALLASDGEAGTAEECALSCYSTPSCLFWSWCPAGAESGCEPVPFGDFKPATTPAPSTCVLSTTPVEPSDASAYVVAAGKAVKWSGGKGLIKALNGSDPFSDPAMALFVEEDELADASLERRNNTLFLGAAVVGGSLNTTSSAEQCAQRCSELLLCAAWAWCPTDAPTGCQILPFGDFISEGVLGRMRPGTCLASLDANETFRAALVMKGQALPWATAYLNPGEPLIPDDQVAPQASPTVEGSPELPSPEPPSPAPLPPADPCQGVTCNSAQNSCQQSPGLCRDGACYYFPQSAGTDCGSGNTCDGSGNCVASPELPPDDPCAAMNCKPAHACLLPPGACKEGTCWWQPAAAGTECEGGGRCDALGNCLPPSQGTSAGGGDTPEDACAGVDCTPLLSDCLLPPGNCKAGQCWFWPAAEGAECGSGGRCDAAGQCVPQA